LTQVGRDVPHNRDALTNVADALQMYSQASDKLNLIIGDVVQPQAHRVASRDGIAIEVLEKSRVHS
jgi:hypothetical protein